MSDAEFEIAWEKLQNRDCDGIRIVSVVPVGLWMVGLPVVVHSDDDVRPDIVMEK